MSTHGNWVNHKRNLIADENAGLFRIAYIWTCHRTFAKSGISPLSIPTLWKVKHKR